jgi:hypothetical protein
VPVRRASTDSWELADEWNGIQPDRSWEAIEHGLSIDAHRGPLGRVLLIFSLREG